MIAAGLGDPVMGTCMCPCPGPCVFPATGIIVSGAPSSFFPMNASIGGLVMFPCGTAQIMGPGAITASSGGIPFSVMGDTVMGGAACVIQGTVVATKPMQFLT